MADKTELELQLEALADELARDIVFKAFARAVLRLQCRSEEDFQALRARMVETFRVDSYPGVDAAMSDHFADLVQRALEELLDEIWTGEAD